MEAKTSLPVLTQGQQKALAVLRQILPRTKDAFLIRCLKAGLDEESLPQAKDLAELHRANLSSIVRWLEEGASLEKIQTALELRDQYPGATTKILLQVYEAAAIQMVPLSEFLAPFEEILEGLRSHSPFNWLVYYIVNSLEGDWQLAHQMATDNPPAFTLLVLGKIDRMTFDRLTIGDFRERVAISGGEGLIDSFAKTPEGEV